MSSESILYIPDLADDTKFCFEVRVKSLDFGSLVKKNPFRKNMDPPLTDRPSSNRKSIMFVSFSQEFPSQKQENGKKNETPKSILKQTTRYSLRAVETPTFGCYENKNDKNQQKTEPRYNQTDSLKPKFLTFYRDGE